MMIYKNNLFELMIETVNFLYPRLEFEVWISDIGEDNGYGYTYFPDDGFPVIEIGIHVPIGVFPEILAHEIAHVIVGIEEGHGEKWDEEFSKIQDKWTELLDEKMTKDER